MVRDSEITAEVERFRKMFNVELGRMQAYYRIRARKALERRR